MKRSFPQGGTFNGGQPVEEIIRKQLEDEAGNGEEEEDRRVTRKRVPASLRPLTIAPLGLLAPALAFHEEGGAR